MRARPAAAAGGDGGEAVGGGGEVLRDDPVRRVAEDGHVPVRV
jgi:hypothetical protein